jgi:hypothetical protein
MAPAYASEPVRIGRTDWRLIIVPARLNLPGESPWNTKYEWRRDGGPWRPDREWPTYNRDDGTYAGCPRTLPRLWEREARALARFGLWPRAMDLIADADGVNRHGQQLADLERVRREREARRDMQPMEAGGLFDDVRRATRDLFEGDL